MHLWAMSITPEDIILMIRQEHVVLGNRNVTINKMTTVAAADESSLVWLASLPANINQLLDQCAAPVIILPLPVPAAMPVPEDKCLVFTADPRLLAITILSRFFRQRPAWGLHPTAIVHPEADVSPETYIGPYSILGKCSIGRGSILYGNNYVHDGVRLGSDVIVHAGAVIGSDGFGYQPDENQEWLKFEHVGGVEVGNGVEIGANTCIDRGTLGNTVIGDGTKIDNLVQIGHNARVGRHCLVISHAMLGGSCEIGDYAWISPGAGILQKVQIGEKATIGFGTIVLKNVPPGETWVGVPARKVEKANPGPQQSA